MESGSSEDGSDDESFGSSAAGGFTTPANGKRVDRTAALAGLSDFEEEDAAAQVASDKSIEVTYDFWCDM